MTSFKNKITRRKRKFSNSKGVVSNVQLLANTLLNTSSVADVLDSSNVSINHVKCSKMKTITTCVVDDGDKERGLPPPPACTTATARPSTEQALLHRLLRLSNGGSGGGDEKKGSATAEEPVFESAKEMDAAVNSGQALFNSASSILAADECDSSFNNSEIETANWSNGHDVTCVDCADNCGVHVTASETGCGDIQIRAKPFPHTVNSYPSSVRYSDSYVSSKYNRDNRYALKANNTTSNSAPLSRSRSGQINIDSCGFYDSSKRCDVIRTNRHGYPTPHSASLGGIQRLGISSGTGDCYVKECAGLYCDAADNMQYSLRINDCAEKQTTKTVPENKRSVKNKKKHDKSKHGKSDVDITASATVSDKDTRNKKTSGASGMTVNTDSVKTLDKKAKKTGKESENSSYLKRVKSRIYKSRSDSNASLNSAERASDVEPMTKTKAKKVKEKKSPDKNHKIPKISEDIFEEASPDVQLRKSSVPMFLRQSSNLERVRPRTFGLRTSASNVGISDLVDSTTNILNVPIEQPKLMKSKSSSAINLNLLRTRRSKLQEQYRKSCKNAETEFDFIAYGAVNKSVTVARKFGANNPPVTINSNDDNTNGGIAFLYTNKLRDYTKTGYYL